jgi:hypothetical protein
MLPGVFTLRKFVKNLMLQSCMIWSETDDVATMPRRKHSKTMTTDPFWMSHIVSQRVNSDDAWDYHRISNLLCNSWLVNAPRSKPYLGFSCRGQWHQWVLTNAIHCVYSSAKRLSYIWMTFLEACTSTRRISSGIRRDEHLLGFD